MSIAGSSFKIEFDHMHAWIIRLVFLHTHIYVCGISQELFGNCHLNTFENNSKIRYLKNIRRRVVGSVLFNISSGIFPTAHMSEKTSLSVSSSSGRCRHLS